jgi:hypothetical protein
MHFFGPRLTTLSLILMLTGCQVPVGPTGELREARDRWLRNGPASYTMTVRRGCGECIREANGPVTITVRDRLAISRTYVATGERVTQELAPLFPTVAELFSIVEILKSSKPFMLDVQYDKELGFPAVISVDYNKNMVDDEISIHVTDFQPQ